MTKTNGSSKVIMADGVLGDALGTPIVLFASWPEREIMGAAVGPESRMNGEEIKYFLDHVAAIEHMKFRCKEIYGREDLEFLHERADRVHTSRPMQAPPQVQQRRM